jgi:hypothetical protein
MKRDLESRRPASNRGPLHYEYGRAVSGICGRSPIWLKTANLTLADERGFAAVAGSCVAHRAFVLGAEQQLVGQEGLADVGVPAAHRRQPERMRKIKSPVLLSQDPETMSHRARYGHRLEQACPPHAFDVRASLCGR